MRRIRTCSKLACGIPATTAFLVVAAAGFFGACSSSSDVHPPADGPGSGDGAADRNQPARDGASGSIGDRPDGDVGLEDASNPADAGPDTSVPPPPGDAGLPPAASLWASPALPAFDAETVAHVRQVRALGQTKSNRPEVVGKLGDSITASSSFFYDVGNNAYALGNYAALGPTIEAIRAVPVGGGKNAFNRDSLAAKGGWTSGDVLAGTPSYVQREVAAIRPGYAIVMFGTNDGNAATLATNMNRIVDQLESEGVVAVVSTIPDRTDYADAGTLIRAINTQVRSITAQRHVPLIDLFAALGALPNVGLGPDGVHPSVAAPGTSGYFNDSDLQYGYNVRNLTAIQMLDRLRALPQ
ncbi:SGNH/GDSL hydrolase family protein [Pendulispora albinea]|uniref:SGNH/GDSL hydrolase family protein n=1 Tax=Pendulispora albinea TaxID=2741071 RepID=A0ABZ2LRP8_9BACT